MPKKIAPDGVVAEALRGGVHFFPSEVPQIIGMKYADRLWAPIVIESIPYPLTGPRGADGVMLNAAMVLQLASLTAWDANDWRQSASTQNFASYRY